MGRLTETARWKLCVPRLTLTTVLIAKGVYLHSLQLNESRIAKFCRQHFRIDQEVKK